MPIVDCRIANDKRVVDSRRQSAITNCQSPIGHRQSTIGNEIGGGLDMIVIVLIVILVVLAIVVIGLIAYFVGIYNNLVALKNTIDRSFADIDVI